MRKLSRSRVLILILVFVAIAGLALTPVSAGGGIVPGPWRDINPTQFASAGDGAVPGPDVPFNGIYVRSAGFGSVGAGEAWAVGGCGPTSTTPPVFPFSLSGCSVAGSTPPGGGTISYYDGFSWTVTGDPFTGQGSFYTGVNFCTSPGAPGVGLCSPNGDGTDGWIVGGNRTGPIAAFVVARGLSPTPVITGLPLGGYLTSVFETCHVDNDPNGKGCPSNLGAGDAYAAGTDGAHGAIYEYTGGAPSGLGGWHAMTITGASATIYNSIYMFIDSTGNLEGFAVGDNGVIARLQGGAWVAVSVAPTTTAFHGVAVDNANPIEAWAVGFDSGPPSGGVVWHFTSGTWSGFLSPSAVGNVSLESVMVLSTSEAWIVGTNSTILHGTNLPGSGFTAISTAGSNVLFSGTGAAIDLNSVNFQSSGNGWAVGTHGVILQTSDSSCGSIVQTSSPSACWGGQTSIVQTKQLRAVYEDSTSDAWAGGLYDTVNSFTSLTHWDGQKWHRANVASGIGTVTKPDIYGIYMVGSGEGYAVGAQAKATGATCGQTYCPAAYTWNTITQNWWQAVNVAQCANANGCNMTSVFFSSINNVDGWAVGSNGGIWTYTKSNPGWSFAATGLPPTFSANLNAIFISNPGGNNPAGWAVGDNATILALNCNAAPCVWSQYSITGLSTDVNLYGIYFSDSNHGWIVGSDNTIITTSNAASTGAIWTVGGAANIASPSTTVWRSVHVDTYGNTAGGGNGWAVGYDSSTGNALTAWFNGATWTNIAIPLPVAPGLGLYSVFTTNPTDGWAVGAQPSTGVNTLSGIFHLDPVTPPTYNGATETTSASSSQVTTTASSSTPSSSSSSTTLVSATLPVSTTSSQMSTIVSTSVSTVTVVSTPTTTVSSATSSVSTPMVLPAIPGFPWESIIAGLILGAIAVAIVRRVKK